MSESSSIYEMAEAVGRTPAAVRLQCRKLEIPFRDTRRESSGRSREWTEEVLEELRPYMLEHSVAEAAEKFGKSKKSVSWAIYAYQVETRGRARKKTPEEIEQIKATVKAKMDEKYPPAGPWVCARCGVEKPVEAFKPGQDGGHVCARCLRDKRLRTAYGITHDEYDQMLEAQDGVCKICEKPETHTRDGVVFPLSVDHDHACCPGRKTCGKCIRGLLCSRCNQTLEKVEELGEGFAQRFAEYLIRT